MSDKTKLTKTIPVFDDVLAAARRVKPAAALTPLLSSPVLNQLTGASVYIKPECLQRTGSFKIRGAYNRLCQLNEQQRRNGVVAFSSGNHAQGVAYAAQLLAIPATIVMPSDAPAIKLENTRAYGAQVVLYDRHRESREQIAAQIADEHNSVLVPSYDDADIIAGQGTVGLEICQQMEDLGVSLDTLLVGCGGGGLIAGSSLAVKALSKDTQVFAVEPEGFDDHCRSLQLDKRVSNDSSARSICDALLAPTPGELTFEINRRHLTGALSISDQLVKEAISFAFKELKLVVEPGGVIALAALLAGKLPVQDKTVAIVLTGGNVDVGEYCSYLQCTH